MDEIHYPFKVQIYGTDLADDAITTARAGFYPPNIILDVTPERLNCFFIKEDQGYRVKKKNRERPPVSCSYPALPNGRKHD